MNRYGQFCQYMSHEVMEYLHVTIESARARRGVTK